MHITHPESYGDCGNHFQLSLCFVKHIYSLTFMSLKSWNSLGEKPQPSAPGGPSTCPTVQGAVLSVTRL